MKYSKMSGLASDSRAVAGLLLAALISACGGGGSSGISSSNNERTGNHCPGDYRRRGQQQPARADNVALDAAADLGVVRRDFGTRRGARVTDCGSEAWLVSVASSMEGSSSYSGRGFW